MSKLSLRFLILCLMGGCCFALITQKLVASDSLVVHKDLLSPEKLQLKGYKRIKRSVEETPRQILQNRIDEAKMNCALEKGVHPHKVRKSYIHEANLSEDDKCMIECMLKKIKIMSTKNKISIEDCKQLAAFLSGNNLMVMDIVGNIATACNREVTSDTQCDAAAQIHNCFKRHFNERSIPIAY